MVNVCIMQGAVMGAIIGDIVGSRFERHNIKSKEFDFLLPPQRNPRVRGCCFTDDTVMTLGVAQAILAANSNYDDLGTLTVHSLRALGRRYPHCGYGGSFKVWLVSETPKPYHSYGNGAAMRISACGDTANSLEEAKTLAQKVTEITHNHPEGLKGAEAVASCIYLAKSGEKIPAIRAFVNEHYYPLDFTLDKIRASYSFDVSCQGSVPQAIEAFLEATDYEDAIRNAISIGGDSDTIAAIAGGIAGAYFDIPTEIREAALTFLDEPLRATLSAYETGNAGILPALFR